MAMELVDSHCHLADHIISNKEVKRLIEADFNLAFCVLQGANIERSREVIHFAKTCNKAYACVGLHPEDANLFSPETISLLAGLARDEKVIGIGEIGLDYHYAGFDATLQKRILLDQLNLAVKLELPVCIHCRDAAGDLYKILKTRKKNIELGVVIHCFSDGVFWAERFVKLGCYISFCGNFTFKNYDKSVIKVVPLNRLMIETDSPYLAPVPHRGEVNNPTNVLCVAECVARELGLNLSEVAQITTQNVKCFYKIK